MTHYLRLFGQSGKCCPAGYYDNKQDEVRESYIDEATIRKNSNPSPNILSYKEVAKLDKCCGNLVIEYKGELDHYNGPDIAEFKKYLCYHHLDLRPFIEYKRITNAQYIDDGSRALLANKSTRKRKTHELEANTLSIKCNEKSVNGVKGIWPFAFLPYCCICENICYDPFHVFKNIIVYLFLYITGKRKMSAAVKHFCLNTLSHPSVNSSSGPVWELSEAKVKSIENDFFKSVVISKGNNYFR
jgi:hypothetical protein